jgi:hypothetical protein
MDFRIFYLRCFSLWLIFEQGTTKMYLGHEFSVLK